MPHCDHAKYHQGVVPMARAWQRPLEREEAQCRDSHLLGSLVLMPRQEPMERGMFKVEKGVFFAKGVSWGVRCPWAGRSPWQRTAGSSRGGKASLALLGRHFAGL